MKPAMIMLLLLLLLLPPYVIISIGFIVNAFLKFTHTDHRLLWSKLLMAHHLTTIVPVKLLPWDLLSEPFRWSLWVTSQPKTLSPRTWIIEQLGIEFSTEGNFPCTWRRGHSAVFWTVAFEMSAVNIIVPFSDKSFPPNCFRVSFFWYSTA